MADALTIGRLRIDCRAPDAATGRRAAEAMTAIARADLGPALQQALDAALPGAWRGDGAVVSLRRVELDLDVDLEAGSAHIVEVWARALARAALRAAAGAEALRFEDRPARLAAFAADLVQGRAWSRWYWRDFDGVKLLPVAAALRTVLLRDPPEGLQALRRAALPVRAQILAALGETDATQCLMAFCAEQPTGSGARLDAVADQAVALLRAPGSESQAHRSPAHLALMLLCAAADPETQDPAGLGGTTLLRLAAVVRGSDAGDGASPMPDVNAGPGQGPVAAGAGSASAADDPIARAVQSARAKGTSSAAPAGTASEPAAETPFGAAFLLWPHVAALPVEAMTASWQGGDPGDPPALLRWLVLARCFGLPAERVVLNDSLLLRLFAPDPKLSAAQAQTWARAQGAATDPSLPEDWLADERVTEAEWRQIDDACHVLKGAGQGYWLRIAARAGDMSGRAPAVLPAPMDTDRQDAKLLLGGDGPALLGQLAQIALKRFAYRLPGFANASVPYLHRNFLSMPAQLAETEDALVAALGPVPLAIMLNLTGAGRTRYALPGGQVVRLVQGGG